MSAIVGICNWNTGPDLEALQNAMLSAPYRGKPGALVSMGRCVLGTLADEYDESGVARSDTLIVAYAGQLDNIDDIVARARISQPDTTSFGERTANAVLQILERFGKDAISEFRGEFAVVWSNGEQIFFATDHFGLRHLYFFHGEGHLVVASEAKQVLAGAGLRREPSLSAVEKIFYGERGINSEHPLGGIRRLPRATTATIRKVGAELHQYWDPAPLLETTKLSISDIRESYIGLLSQSVGRTMKRPGSIAISLSGGLDSPIVAALASEQMAQPGTGATSLGAITTVYPQFPNVDEEKYARIAASQFKIELNTVRRSAPILSQMNVWTPLLDVPSVGWLIGDAAEHYRQARELQYQYMLTGELAEELTDNCTSLLSHLIARKRLTATGRHIMRFRLEDWKTLAFNHLGKLNVLRNEDGRVPSWINSEYATYSGRPHDWQDSQLRYLRQLDLVREQDEICQVASGIRVRRPWLDVDLWEFVLSLPAEDRYPSHERKEFIRKLARNKVPDIILQRNDKTVFSDAIVSRLDSAKVKKALLPLQVSMIGVDEELLGKRLDEPSLPLSEWIWILNLMACQAFLMSA